MATVALYLNFSIVRWLPIDMVLSTDHGLLSVMVSVGRSSLGVRMLSAEMMGMMLSLWALYELV